MKVQIFLNQIKHRFELAIPNGYCSVERLALGRGYCIRLGMIKNLKDCTSSIRMNDPAHTLIFMYNVPHDPDTVLSTVKVEFDGCRIFTNGKRCKVPTRMFDKEPKQALKALEKFFYKLKDALQECANEGIIYGQERIKPEYLDFDVNYHMENQE